MRELLKHRVEQNVKLYENLEVFVKDVSSKFSPDVRLDNIKNLFLYLGAFLALVSLVFVLNVFLIKKLKLIHRKLSVRPSLSKKQIRQSYRRWRSVQKEKLRIGRFLERGLVCTIKASNQEITEKN